MMKFLYQKALKPLLFHFDPEDVHHWFVAFGGHAGRFKIIKSIIELIYGKPKSKSLTVDGIVYEGPVMLSAGFDYNAHLSEILYSIGFSGEEVGSVTARPCEGNPKPRMRRLIKSQSIQVYKGLRNDGVENIIQRIKTKKIPKEFVLGMSIAKTNDPLAVSMEDGISDYCYSLKRLVEEKIGDFYTINISCPNAFGGEDFTTPDRLEHLLCEFKKIAHKKPMYVKMPINLDWEKFKLLLDVIKKHQFNGVVVGNLNKNYNDVADLSEKPAEFRGGLSGAPCRDLSNELIKKTREYLPTHFTIIGCGGILNAEDAMTKLRLGANLLQLITGMIFTGPQLLGEINQAYKDSTN